MKDKKSEFISELKQLLKKYNAEIDADDHYEGYPECGKDIRMTLTFNDSFEEHDLGSCLYDGMGVKE